VAQVENRYLELASPAEFDGIRTQIAQELSIPKTAVKKIIKELRDRQHIPSWWEVQVYKGSDEELASIKAVYEPLLPIPPVGVHKQIAEQLSLKPGIVYQAIKAIRQELKLPQYNDPEVHGEEFVHKLAKQAEGDKQPEQVPAASSEEQPSASEQTPTPEAVPAPDPEIEAPASSTETETETQPEQPAPIAATVEAESKE
jgi:DNA-binding MarR family transcriptional regulator